MSIEHEITTVAIPTLDSKSVCLSCDGRGWYDYVVWGIDGPLGADQMDCADCERTGLAVLKSAADLELEPEELDAPRGPNDF